MFVLKTADGLYYQERWTFGQNEKTAKKYATPSAAQRKLAKLLEGGVVDVRAVAVAGVIDRPKAAESGDKAKKPRKKKAERTFEDTEIG